MGVESLAEQDSSWEDDDQRFRVYFFDTGRGKIDTYDVTRADALQVIEWAQRRAASRWSATSFSRLVSGNEA